MPLRFTPACVGTISSWRSPPRGRAVHPRVRGDDLMMITDVVQAVGSPPRAWGRCRMIVVLIPPLRFTPACVGTIPHVPARPQYPAVHPRVRGDDVSLPLHEDGERGSPPRAWGRSSASRGSSYYSRFTPACVGTMLPPAHLCFRLAVHPRVRGDDVIADLSGTGPLGSPPRAWGRSQRCADEVIGWRFTPACVGTIAVCRPSCRPPAVHPRVRGDDRARHRLRAILAGSPPRAWGRWPPQAVQSRAHRFTPACVGTIAGFRFA